MYQNAEQSIPKEIQDYIDSLSLSQLDNILCYVREKLRAQGIEFYYAFDEVPLEPSTRDKNNFSRIAGQNAANGAD